MPTAFHTMLLMGLFSYDKQPCLLSDVFMHLHLTVQNNALSVSVTITLRHLRSVWKRASTQLQP